MNIYFAVGGAMVCAFMAGFAVSDVIWRSREKAWKTAIAELIAIAKRARDAKGRYCK